MFSGVSPYEPMTPPQGAKVLAKATAPGGQAAIIAAALGRGMAIRVGLPELPSRLSHPGNETALVKRVVELLSR